MLKKNAQQALNEQQATSFQYLFSGKRETQNQNEMELRKPRTCRLLPAETSG